MMRRLLNLWIPTLCLLFASPAAAVTLLSDARDVRVAEFNCNPNCGLVVVSDEPSAPFAPFDSQVQVTGRYSASQVSAVAGNPIHGRGAVQGQADGTANSRIRIEFEVLEPTPIVFEASLWELTLDPFNTDASAGVSLGGAGISESACGACTYPLGDLHEVVIETVLDPGIYTVAAGAGTEEFGFQATYDFSLTFVYPCGSAPCPDCDDGIDNDGDGFCDLAGSTCLDGSTPGDSSCLDPDDDSEVRLCSDGFDNDGDGKIDHPDDPGCVSPDSNIEDPQCDDQIDNDGDGFCDTSGATCLDGSTPSDRDCFPFPSRDSELPICSDGLDNDRDGLVDQADPGCANASQRSEAWAACGLGWELALVLPLIGLARRHPGRVSANRASSAPNPAPPREHSATA